MIKIETNCRRHFKVHLKWKINTIQGRKHCEKRRNCLLQAISPFLTMFSTAISSECQNVVLCDNGLSPHFSKHDSCVKPLPDMPISLRAYFSFSHNVFKSCLLLVRQNEYLWSKGLRYR